MKTAILLLALAFPAIGFATQEPAPEVLAEIEVEAPTKQGPYLLRAMLPVTSEIRAGMHLGERFKVGGFEAQLSPGLARQTNSLDVAHLVVPVEGPGPFTVEIAERDWRARSLRKTPAPPSRFDLFVELANGERGEGIVYHKATLQEGAWETVTRYWIRFRLPRRGGEFLGAKVFEYRRAATNATEYTIEISNSVVDPATGQTDGPVYFRRIVMRSDPGTALEPQVMRKSMTRHLKNELELVAAPERGQHVLLPQHQFVRRVALCEEAYLREARQLLDCYGVGWVTKGGYTEVPAYGPHMMRLPVVDQAFALYGLKGRAAWVERKARELRGLEEALRNGGSLKGKYSVHLEANGWQHAIGGPLGWDHGGEGIWFWDGIVGCREEFANGRLQAAMRSERMRINSLHPSDGRHLTPHDFAQRKGIQPFRIFSGSSWEHQVPYFKKWVEKVWTSGVCEYEPQLVKLGMHDGQHFIRAAKEPMKLCWWQNDAWAREAAIGNATWFWVVHPEINYVYRSDGQNVVGGLGVSVQRNKAKPFIRGELGRESGWWFYTASIAWHVAPQRWRRAAHRWYQATGELAFYTTISSTPDGLGLPGFSQSRISPGGNWSSDPWGERFGKKSGKQYIGAGETALQSIEERIIKNGIFALARSGALAGCRVRSDPSADDGIQQRTGKAGESVGIRTALRSQRRQDPDRNSEVLCDLGQVLLAQVVNSARAMHSSLVENPWGKKGTGSFVSVTYQAQQGRPQEPQPLPRSIHGGPEVTNSLSATTCAMVASGNVDEFLPTLYDLLGLTGSARNPKSAIKRVWQMEAEFGSSIQTYSPHTAGALPLLADRAREQ